MTFSNDKAIYIQMADRLCDDILAGVYTDDERIPSVREYAVKLEVNTNTAVKAYDYLARDGIIYNKRGLGYFVTAGARETHHGCPPQGFHGEHPARRVPQHAASRCRH